MALDSTLQHKGAEVSVEWKIGGFLSLQKEIGYKLVSPIFRFSDAQWSIRIYPNGRSDDPGWVSLYLCREKSSSPNHNLRYTLGIRKRDGSDFESKDSTDEVFCKSDAWGWNQFVEISKLHDKKDEVLEEETLNVFCTARDITKVALRGNVAIEKASQTPPQKGIDILLKCLKDLTLGGRLSDVTFVVEDQKFPAHRSMLGARSRVFSAMFEHETEEKKTGVVNIDDCNASAFREFLTFLYTASLDVISSSNAVAVYKIAEKYDLQDLKRSCVCIMTDTVTEETFFDIVSLATLHDESDLLEAAIDFFIKNMKGIFQNPNWQTFNRDNVALCNELLLKMADKVG